MGYFLFFYQYGFSFHKCKNKKKKEDERSFYETASFMKRTYPKEFGLNWTNKHFILLSCILTKIVQLEQFGLNIISFFFELSTVFLFLVYQKYY